MSLTINSYPMLRPHLGIGVQYTMSDGVVPYSREANRKSFEEVLGRIDSFARFNNYGPVKVEVMGTPPNNTPTIAVSGSCQAFGVDSFQEFLQLASSQLQVTQATKDAMSASGLRI